LSFLTVDQAAGAIGHAPPSAIADHPQSGAFHGPELWFYAIQLIPLAQVFALNFTPPLGWLSAVATVLGERLTPMRPLARESLAIGIS